MDEHLWPLLGIIIIVGIPAAVSTLFFASIRAAFVRRIGGHAAEDEAALVALKFRTDALEREVDHLTQALQRLGSPASFPPQPPLPPGR